MGSKNKPGEFDCYAAAEPNEPMFTLLGRDEDAPELIEDWCRKRLAKLLASDMTREQLHRGVSKIAEALVCANQMRDWYADDGTIDFFNVPPIMPLSDSLVDLFRPSCFTDARDAIIRSMSMLPEGVTQADLDAATPLPPLGDSRRPRGWATGLDGPGEPRDPNRFHYRRDPDERHGIYGGARTDRLPPSEPHPSSECEARGCGDGLVAKRDSSRQCCARVPMECSWPLCLCGTALAKDIL